jgi:P4 family phage/plasmid primase-like protien
MTTLAAHDLYERLGAVVISGNMSAKQNKKGEWKKIFGFRSKWEQTTKHNYDKKQNGYAMLTGERHDMIAIDIDDPSLECAKELMEMMSSCNLVAKTNKGFHYVWKYNEELKQTTGNDEIKIDIRSDGGCIFCEPTLAKAADGTVVAQYKWIKTPSIEEDGELADLEIIPQEVINYLGAIDPRYIGGQQIEKVGDAVPVEASTEASDASEVSEPKNEEVSAEASPKGSPINQVLLKVIEALPVKYLDNYSEWVKIGMVLYNENFPLSDWEHVSSRSDKYEEGACEKKWHTFQREKGTKVTGASLWKLLKESNPSAFWGLMEFRKDFWNLIECVNHIDVARYFYNINPDAYLWEETMGWYTLNFNNIWKHSEKAYPSGLKRHIADTMQDLANDTKKAELADYAKKMEAIKDNKVMQGQLLDQHRKKLGEIFAAYKTFGSSDFCNGVMSFLPSFYAMENLQETMDMNREIFAFTDGCFDLKKGVFRAISPHDYISTTTGFPAPKKSDPKVRTAIKKFLWTIFENEEDVTYLCQVLASCLFGSNRWEEFYVFTGTGGNGKGVISDLLKSCFGDYYLSVDITLFTKPLERKDQPVPALVEARSKRIMMTTEPESDDRLQSGLIKKISGGDIIEARTLHSKHIVKYVPQFKLILQVNDIPKVNKMDGGIERRMRIINFPFKFVSAEKMSKPEHRLGDPDIKDKLCKCVEWRDEFLLILTEIYASIKDLKALSPPKSVAEATGEYFDDNNPIKTWLSNYYQITGKDEDKIGASELKRQYMDDCNLEKASDTIFKQALSFNGILSKRTKTGMCYTGIKRKEKNPAELLIKN